MPTRQLLDVYNNNKVPGVSITISRPQQNINVNLTAAGSDIYVTHNLQCKLSFFSVIIICMDDEDIAYITCTQFIPSVGIQLTLCSADPEGWYIPHGGKWQ
jgi:hypothetical protein